VLLGRDVSRLESSGKSPSLPRFRVHLQNCAEHRVGRIFGADHRRFKPARLFAHNIKALQRDRHVDAHLPLRLTCNILGGGCRAVLTGALAPTRLHFCKAFGSVRVPIDNLQVWHAPERKE
jgi:hypothetical protein